MSNEEFEKYVAEKRTTIHGALGEPCDYVRVSDVRSLFALLQPRWIPVSELHKYEQVGNRLVFWESDSVFEFCKDVEGVLEGVWLNNEGEHPHLDYSCFVPLPELPKEEA